jgi:ribulose-5-phosphate 4-epimerase/fuculose-1-phosphate aldolase
MNKQEAIQLLLKAADFFEQQSAGYKSWGKVEVLQIAMRLDNNEIITTPKSKALSSLTAQDIVVADMILSFLKSFLKEKKCR